MSSAEHHERAVSTATSVAQRYGIAVDDDLDVAITLFALVVPQLGFAQAASKLVYDIAVLTTDDLDATPVALAALRELSGLEMERTEALRVIVREERARLQSLTLSTLTLTPHDYDGLRNDLRILGHVRIRVELQLGLRESLVAEP